MFFFHLYWGIVDKSRFYAWKPPYILAWLPAEDSGSQQKTLALSSQVSHLQNMPSQPVCSEARDNLPSFLHFCALFSGRDCWELPKNIPVLIPSHPCFIRINFPKTTFFFLLKNRALLYCAGQLSWLMNATRPHLLSSQVTLQARAPRPHAPCLHAFPLAPSFYLEWLCDRFFSPSFD